MGCVQGRKIIIHSDLIKKAKDSQINNLTEAQMLKKKTLDSNQVKPRVKSSTIINSRLHKSFLYSKPLFSIETIDRMIDSQKIKKDSTIVANEDDDLVLKIESGDEEIKTKKNNNLCVDSTSKQTKITQSSFEYTSNDDSSTPTKIIRKLEINPYRNINTIKKFFIYQLKKIYLQSKKSISPKENFSSFNHPHVVFSNYSQLNAKEANVFIKFEDKNVQINDYFIFKNKIIGRGKGSYVYLCQDLSTKMFYAAKIQPKKANTCEIDILKRLHSKYIVTVYEIIETKNENYIIMEFMQNNSLSINLDNLDLFCVWKYFRNLISAVEYCHEIAKVIHRDITLSNCLIDENDILKLSNFSNSISLNEDGTVHLVDINSDSQIFFSPPEASLRLSDCDVDGKAIDIWMMGSVLYALVYRKSFIPISTKVLTEEDYSIERIKCPEDKELENLMICLLEPDPLKRYTIDEIKKNKWVTKDNEFPMPDVYEEALDYCYKMTSEKMNMKNSNVM